MKVMRKAKRIVAAMLAMVLALAMTVTVFADQTNGTANTYSVKIEKADKGHTYEAYQIFAGELSEDGTKLSNITWGSGIDPKKTGQADLGDAAAYAEYLSGTGIDAKAEAAKLANYLTTATASTSNAVQNGETYDYEITGLPAGYYLVKDADGSLGNTESAYTSYILQVVNNVTVTPKTDVPTVEKFVKDINDTTDTDYTEWKKTADHDVNDVVPFKLVATMPDNIDRYDTYTLVFHDELSAGLTYEETDGYTVKIDGTEISANLFVRTITKNQDGSTNIDFACTDIKSLGQPITADTKIEIEYNAVLNENCIIGATGNPNEVYLDFSNNPNNSGNGDYGKTPKDKVIVFTYKVVINKIDQNKNPLTGAEFTLFKKLADGTQKEISCVKVKDQTTFEFLRLDDGEYVLKETKTPDGYNSIPDVSFKITASHDDQSLMLTNLNGDQIQDGTAIVLAFSSDLPTGALTSDVMNKQGAVLPSTGGAGTVLLYTIGGILVLGAAIFLITKKRVNR